MPVEFLSDAEAAAYGRYDGGPSREELDRVFFLDDTDRELIARRRGEHNRLGFALQLTTVRWLGVFLPDPTDVPAVVLQYLARQLEIEDPSCVGRYLERRPTRFDHAEEIKRACGLREFAQAREEFQEWLSAQPWMTGDGPRSIFVDAVGWLRERDVLLPGVTTLARLVATARADAEVRLWETWRRRRGDPDGSREQDNALCVAVRHGHDFTVRSRVRRLDCAYAGDGVSGFHLDRVAVALSLRQRSRYPGRLCQRGRRIRTVWRLVLFVDYAAGIAHLVPGTVSDAFAVR